MKKKVVFILTLLLLIGGAYFYFFYSEEKKNNPERIRESVENLTGNFGKKTPPPYSIEDLRAGDYERELRIEEALSTSGSFTTHIVSYTSEGLKQFALMQTPNTNEDKYPVIIVNHGYISPEVYSTENSYNSITSYYASRGFLVLKPDYRGHANSEKGVDSALNRAAYAQDVLSLLYSINSTPEADSENVFMFGHSMGGDITLRVLASSDKVKAATLWAPVSVEFPESLLYFVRRHRSDEETRKVIEELEAVYKEEDYKNLTPLNYFDSVEASILIHHGTSDTSVPYEWSQDLAKSLEGHGVDFTFYTYEGADHNMRPNITEALQRDVEFFRENLD